MSNRPVSLGPCAGLGAPLRILVAEDDRATLLFARAILGQVGHQVLGVSDGAAAIQTFRQVGADLVLMDLNMPRVDGLHACRIIKAEAADRYVPVLFVTGASDEDLVRCIAAGGDGFIQKPFNPQVLLAQVRAFQRTMELHRVVEAQRERLLEHQEQMLQEQKSAAAVFDRILSAGKLHAPNLRHLLRPASRFGGDLVLAADRPSGGQLLLLGDFTGHGLPAAVGAIPVSDLFYSLAADGYDFRTILQEINRKLYDALPLGMFFAAAIAELDPQHGRVAVWNGGMPDVLLFRRGQGIRHRFVSRNPPLGVLAPAKINPAVEFAVVSRGDTLFFCSDGVTEGGADATTVYGEARLDAHFSPERDPDSIFDAICVDLEAHHGGRDAPDDIAMLQARCEVRALGGDDPQGSAAPAVHPVPAAAAGLRLAVHLDALTLRRGDPLPLLVQAVAEHPALRSYQQQICTVLAELVNNAIQHGLLGVSSAVKGQPHGFTRFYDEVERRRSALRSGHVGVELEHRSCGSRHEAVVRVSDSGSGYDFSSTSRRAVADGSLSGRGLPLVRSLADRVSYDPATNTTEAVIAWTYSSSASPAAAPCPAPAS